MPFFSKPRGTWRGQVKFRGKTYQSTFYTRGEAATWEAEKRWELEQQVVEPAREGFSEYGQYGHIYFVRSGEKGPIKIGWSKNPNNRIKSLKTASPAPIVFLASFPGKKSWELDLHKRFADLRLHGEWFTPSKRLLRWISQIVMKGEVV